MTRILVYKTLTKKSSWPKEWIEHEEFREHWQEFKQILGKDLPGKFLCSRLNMNIIICVIAVKNSHDHYNFNKCIESLKVDYPNRKFIPLEDTDLT